MTERENIEAHITEHYIGLADARQIEDEIGVIFHETNCNIWLECLTTYLGSKAVEEVMV